MSASLIVFYGIGTFSVNRFADGSLAKTLLHGAGGGIMSRLRGGSFKSGFLSTAATHLLGSGRELRNINLYFSYEQATTIRIS